MEFRTLNYFLGVLENRSYTAAAEALHITQPALTKAVQRLEAELEVELFDRDSRGTEPTKYGELLAVHARRLNEEHKHAKLEIENLKNGFNESVRVGAGPVWSSRMLPQATKRLREEGHRPPEHLVPTVNKSGSAAGIPKEWPEPLHSTQHSMSGAQP
ncbi:MAG: LysR family transcriptional regulator [Rhodospirillaceae bacterium]|nr:LysR family transcriptional regulator [Rhodospirillaceae bacterium]